MIDLTGKRGAIARNVQFDLRASSRRNLTVDLTLAPALRDLVQWVRFKPAEQPTSVWFLKVVQPQAK